MLNNKDNIKMEKVCRSCMSENDELRNLFYNKASGAEDGPQLSEMIMACTQIQVVDGDGLPPSLCIACEIKLTIAYDFKTLCEKSDKSLRQLSNHLSVPISDPPYQSEEIIGCLYCDEQFTSQKELRSHEKKHPEAQENKDVKYNCDECGFVFKSLDDLTTHKKDHQISILVVDKIEDESNITEDMDTNDSEETNTEVLVNFWCKKCEKDFVCEESFIEHNAKHDAENRCTICNKKFSKSTHVKRHMRNTHRVIAKVSPKKKTMECEFCDRVFKYKKSFNHHMLTEHGMEATDSDTPLSELIVKENDEDGEVQAEIKDDDEETIIDSKPERNLEPKVELQLNEEMNNEEEALSSYPLEEFMKTYQKEITKKIHICHVCDHRFSRANHLTRHMTLHRAVLTYKCDKCDKAYASQEHLDKHHQEDHINKPYTCTICNKTFSRGEHLIRHLKLHGPMEKGSLGCSVCTKQFSRPDHLARHLKIHLQNDKRHICNDCGKTFTRLDNLKTHQRTHTGLKDTAKLHLCIYCGKEFNNSSNMIVHMRRHTGERPYKCNECGKGFPRSHDLKCHERTHSGEKPYLCTLCGKSFNKSNKLLRHTRVHTGERPYVCNLCGRAFTQSNDLALHMRRHTGSRPYACGVCPMRFIQSGQLKAHRKSSGHWTETQPELKGGHRVEKIVGASLGPPIKFKFRNPPKPSEDEEDEDEIFSKAENKVLSSTANSLLNNIQNQSVTTAAGQTMLVEGNRFIEQYPMSGFPNASNINIPNQVKVDITEEERVKMQVANASTFHTYTTTPTTSTFTNSETYNYQTYG